MSNQGSNDAKPITPTPWPLIQKEEVTKDDLNKVLDAVNRLESKIDTIFGDYMLINGEWVDLEDIRTRKPRENSAYNDLQLKLLDRNREKK